MPELNDQQFAQYSALRVPANTPVKGDYDYKPLPASMERHAPGEYQPTLPGMEKMLPNEMTHVNAVFKHDNVAPPIEIGGREYAGDIPGSRWYHVTSNYHPQQRQVQAQSLRPSQKWLDDNHLHEDIHENTLANQGTTPKVEFIRGQNVIQDGHHRAAREILGGAKKVAVERWGGKDYV